MNYKWKFITGAVGLVSIYYLMFLRTKKSSIEKKSSFVDSEFGKRVKFKITNNTDEKQIVPIFKSKQNIQNQELDITPSMNEFNRDLVKEPKKIRGIEIVPCDSTVLSMITNEVNKVINNDKTPLKPSFTSDKIGEEVLLFEPTDLKVDGDTHLEYEMKPKTSVYIMFHYE
jgi:hypothetical protein